MVFLRGGGFASSTSLSLWMLGTRTFVQRKGQEIHMASQNRSLSKLGIQSSTQDESHFQVQMYNKKVLDWLMGPGGTQTQELLPHPQMFRKNQDAAPPHHLGSDWSSSLARAGWHPCASGPVSQATLLLIHTKCTSFCVIWELIGVRTTARVHVHGMRVIIGSDGYGKCFVDVCFWFLKATCA